MKENKIPTGTRLGDWLKWGKAELKDCPIGTPSLDAEVLMMTAFDLERIILHVYPERELPKEKIELYQSYIARRKAEEPIRYITGGKEFMGLYFTVRKGVLIPRNDTETIVEAALEKAREIDGKKALEIGVGSGAIAVSLLYYLKKEGREFSMVGTDVEEIPLEVTRENAERHGVSEDLTLIKGDLFQPLDKGGRQFDLILSNPPYLSESEMKEVAREVRDHEPRTALFAEEGGLRFYREIISEAPAHLRDNGYLLLEIGHSQGNDVYRMMRKGGFRSVKILKDLENRDRVVLGKL